jgi:hypothetical protein
MGDDMKAEVLEMCVNACEKHTTNNENAAKMIKELVRNQEQQPTTFLKILNQLYLWTDNVFFGPGQLTSTHFILQARFYKPTVLHPPFSRITLYETMPVHV